MYLEFTQSGFPTMEIQLQNQTPAIGHTVWQCKLSILRGRFGMTWNLLPFRFTEHIGILEMSIPCRQHRCLATNQLEFQTPCILK